MHLLRRTPSRPGRLLIATGALAALGFTAPAQAAEAAYAPGDVVTVDGVSVVAPAPGHSVALSVTRVDAPSTLLVVHTDAAGQVTVGDDVDLLGAPAGGGPNKCDDPAYSLIYGFGWDETYNWAFRKSTTPNEMTKKAATRELKRAMNNITRAKNGCGLADQVSATNRFTGNTTQASDVTSQPACVSNPQPVNVTEFGPMGGGGILAATCVYAGGGELTDADVKINTEFEWWEGKGSCGGAYGLQGVQTHEYGHAYGLGHVSESDHGNLTMSTNINGTCSNFEASLGRGDVLALQDLY